MSTPRTAGEPRTRQDVKTLRAALQQLDISIFISGWQKDKELYLKIGVILCNMMGGHEYYGVTFIDGERKKIQYLALGII